MRRRCDECESEFEPYREWHRFCTEFCRREWHHKRYAAIQQWWHEQEEREHEQQVEHRDVPLARAGRG